MGLSKSKPNKISSNIKKISSRKITPINLILNNQEDNFPRPPTPDPTSATSSITPKSEGGSVTHRQSLNG